jgi:serine/threonine protein kinase
MGEVYRARDSRLDRDVAIKVLPSNFSADANLKQRLEREAKAVSKLSHPHICTLYDVGLQDGQSFLVMELLEGETLDQRLSKGSLPPEQAIRYGAQIADALATAHKLGFTHRDLKPSNVMLTKSGAKLMDFGLAKQSGPPLAAALTEMTVDQSKLTGDGMLVGTFQYMAPEQLEGKEADARTDIFALGEVLYEMTTGKPAFSGKSRASLIASILTTEPTPISLLQPLTPPALERVVKKCLSKDPDDRWQSANDLATELKWTADSQVSTTTPEIGRRKSRERLFWELVAIFGLLLGGLVGWLAREHVQPEPVTERTSRVSIIFPRDHFVDPFSAAISPDGMQIAFAAAPPQGKQQLWVRSLSSLSPQPIAGTDNAYGPFWSPDSRQIGFFADGKLKRVDFGGGQASTLADAPNGRGGAWSSNGEIVFSPDISNVLYRVRANGGVPTQLTTFVAVPATTHRWPYFMPDGKHLLFLAQGLPRSFSTGDGKTVSASIYAVSVDSGEVKLVLRSSRRAIFSEPGYLLFFGGANLLGQRFDTQRLEAVGEPFVVAEHVQQDDRYGGAFSVSATGRLLYSAGPSEGVSLTWFSSGGESVETVGEANFNVARLSPDNQKVATSLVDEETGTSQLWIYDIARGTRSRFAFGPANRDDPVWSPDGKAVAFDSAGKDSFGLYLKRADSSQPEELLWQGDTLGFPTSWSPDAKYLAYDKLEKGQNQYDIWMLPMVGEHKPFAYLNSSTSEHFGEFAPDGKWVAYASNATGREEVYVATFPDSHARFQISSAGGSNPKWRHDGRELYYVDADRNIVAVPVSLVGDTAEVGKPRVLFRVTGLSPGYALNVSTDGQRFLLPHYSGLRTSDMTLVTNWTNGWNR